MTLQEIADKLNSLKRYDEAEGPAYAIGKHGMDASKYGDYLRVDDVLAAFGLVLRSGYDEFQLPDDV